jgi:hypothetical protein
MRVATWHMADDVWYVFFVDNAGTESDPVYFTDWDSMQDAVVEWEKND